MALSQDNGLRDCSAAEACPAVLRDAPFPAIRVPGPLAYALAYAAAPGPLAYAAPADGTARILNPPLVGTPRP